MQFVTRQQALHGACGLLSRTIGRLDVSGQDHVPASGPCLLIFNHLSNFDLPVLYGAVPRIDFVGLVAASYRDNPLVRPWIEAEGSIWLRRGEADRASLRAALQVLSEGRVVGMSPEGGRSPDHSLRQAKPGGAALAIRSGVPIVPVGIWGTERLHRSWRRLHRPAVSVRFGRTFQAPPPGPGSRRTHRQEVTRLMMETIADLIPPAYRGHYGRSSVPTTASASGRSS